MHLAAANQTVDSLKVKIILSLIFDFFVKLNSLCLCLYFVLTLSLPRGCPLTSPEDTYGSESVNGGIVVKGLSIDQ